MRLLLLSNSTAPGRGFLEHAYEPISDVMAGGTRLVFFAHASSDPDRYAEAMQASLETLGIEVIAAHRSDRIADSVAEAEAIFVGGGNSFRLLKAFHDLGLLDAVRDRVSNGMPYLGASAGSNLACPTIRTTNDMPIVEPPALTALGLVPFQINPHYLDRDDAAPPGAETRDQRIREFLEENDVPVVGLREGAWIDVHAGAAVVGGPPGGRLFRRGAEPAELHPGDDLTELLTREPAYDSPLERLG
ncbi:MAG TPA: dipeptidase PepE [Gaiellaceae bacterium]